MANILEFLRGVLTDDVSQAALRSDPEGFVTRSGFADLTGEDVVEGILVLRRTLPPGLADRLADFEDEHRLPAVRPSFHERDLDAALRQLHHAIELATSDAAPVEHTPIAAEAEPVLADPDAVAAQATPDVAPPLYLDSPVREEPIEVDAEPALATAPPTAPATHRWDGLASTHELAAAVAAAADDARSLLGEYVEDVKHRLEAVLGQAEKDAEAIRAEAEAERATARQVLLVAREEAERIRDEAARGMEELEARRAELRDAERELRERVAGLDSLFRTVLKEE